jgi:hypothetical protein
VKQTSSPPKFTDPLSQSYQNKLVAEYRALAHPPTMVDPKDTSTVVSAKSNSNDDIRLVPNPLFWEQNQNVRRSNIKRPGRPVPSKRTSAVFVPRNSNLAAVKRRSSLVVKRLSGLPATLQARRRSKSVVHKGEISGPIPMDSFIAPMQPQTPTTQASTKQWSTPPTPTLVSTPPTASTTTPRTPTTPSKQYMPYFPGARVSKLYTMSPSQPSTPLQQHRPTISADAAVGGTVIRIPVSGKAKTADITYVTNLEGRRVKVERNKNRSQTWSSPWPKRSLSFAKTPLLSAMKSVRASLSPRSSVRGQKKEHKPKTPRSAPLPGRRRSSTWGFADRDREDLATVGKRRKESGSSTKGQENGQPIPGWGLKELLAEKREEKMRKKRGEEIKKMIKYVAVVDPSTINYDLKPDDITFKGDWI